MNKITIPRFDGELLEIRKESQMDMKNDYEEMETRKMACNKRMIDIEREINDFFASVEFKKLAFSYDGVYRDYCNSEKFQIFNDTPIEPICRGVNEKIREIIDNATINMFIRNNGIYMESDFPFGRKRDIQIGKLIITECGCGGRKDNWIIRFDNEYIYHTFQCRSENVARHYRVLDVKEKIMEG